MKRVLLPIDGSECALRGVALLISKRAFYLSPDDIEIHLVNVQAPFSHDVSRFVSPEQTAGFHRVQSEQALRDACALRDAAGARYVCHPEVSKTAEVISGLAKSLQCDQIVMGTHGQGRSRSCCWGRLP